VRVEIVRCPHAQAHPQVHVQVGRRAFDAIAESLSQEAVAQMLAEMVRVNPCSLRMFARWSDAPVDSSPESLRALAVHFPSLVLRPVGGSRYGNADGISMA
jgi:hypothetical protein